MEEEILQDRLELLEEGERLENILTGLPEEEIELLNLAAQILDIPKPVRNTFTVQEQQRRVIQAVQQNRATSSFPFSLKTLIPVGVFLFLFVGIVGVFSGLVWLSTRDNATPAPIASSNTDVDKATETISGGTPVTGQFPTPTSASPQTASLQSIHGIVQVQQADNSWLTVQTIELEVGKTFRTLTLSSAQLAFFDGSVVSLGANTSITIEALNVQKEGPRQVTLFQSYGETSHVVVASSESGSSYLVRTPFGMGEAKGTIFEVAVAENKTDSFAVVEGEVVVTGQQASVSLAPGQATVIEQDAPPSEPAFWINGQGEVTQMGDVWVIGGVEFHVHEHTPLIGDPQLGDLVSVRGRLLPDGTRLADQIEALSPAFVNRFRIRGVVESMDSASWTISGQEIQVNEDIQIDEGVELGSQVLVRGVAQQGGQLLATHIQIVDESARFEFTGLVEQIEGRAWSISGIAITTNAETEILGDPVVGDLVHVEGQVLPDGTWPTHKIEKVSEANHFEFIGTVQQMRPWVVESIALEMNELTQISPGIEVGSLVRVAGIILRDGTWLASEIQLLEDEPGTLVFIGVVNSLDPWVVNGISLNVTPDTVIVGDITVQALVRVYVRVLEDGIWQIMRIELIEIGPVPGCIEFGDQVASFTDTEITLASGMIISREVAEITGRLEVGSEVRVILCFGRDQEIAYALIIVLEDEIEPTPTLPTSTLPAPTPGPTSEPTAEPTSQPTPEPTSQPTPEPTTQPTPEPSPEEEVTICHIPPGNPDNPETITVPPSAVDAHLAHGDYLGPCQ